VDVEIVLAGLTEVQAGKGHGVEDRILSSAKVVEMLLRSWSGIMYLCLNGRQALVSLVSALRTPSKFVRVRNCGCSRLVIVTDSGLQWQETLLDTLSSVFRVGLASAPPKKHGVVENGHSSYTKYSFNIFFPTHQVTSQLGRLSTIEETHAGETGSASVRAKSNIIDQYLAMLLIVFIQAGLVDVCLRSLVSSVIDDIAADTSADTGLRCG
jgi:hypothetical protein